MNFVVYFPSWMIGFFQAQPKVWNIPQGLEYPEAECIAAGLRDARPDADMWFVDPNGALVSQYEIIRRRAEYLIWAADQGDFYLKHEATAFMRSLVIAKMARQGELPRANPDFLKGILDNFDAIQAIEKEIVPLILERIKNKYFEIDLTDLEHTHPEFVEKCQSARNQASLVSNQTSIDTVISNLGQSGIPIHRYTQDELKEGDFGYKELAEKLEKKSYLARTGDDLVTLPAPPIDMKGTAVFEHDGRSLFTRRLHDNTNERERHQIISALGSMETVTPEDGRCLYVYNKDEKSEYEPLIERLNAQGRVHFHSDFKSQIAALGTLPKLSMAEGEAIPGQDAVTLLRQTHLARRITDFCFTQGSQKNSDAAQDIVLATRMQMGLEAGSAIDPAFIRVFDEKGHFLTLADRVKLLWTDLEDELAKSSNPAAHLTERTSAVVQLYMLHRLARQHTMRDQTFTQLRAAYPHLHLPHLEWERINTYMFAYDHRELDQFWHQKIKPALNGPAVLAVTLQHMEFFEDVKALHEKEVGLQQIETSQRPAAQTKYGSHLPSLRRKARP